MKLCRISFLILIMATLLFSGCGYRFIGANSGDAIRTNRQTVWVDFIGNTTSSSIAQTILKRGMLDEFHAFRGMAPATTRSDSDMVISGNIKSYSTRAVSYNAADQIREFRLTIDVELEVRNKTSQKVVWIGLLSASHDFPASDPRNPDLALQKNAEEAALVAASRKLAQSLIISMEDSY